MTHSEARVGQVALVTGGSRGIGFAVAQRLLVSGMSVAILGRDRAALADAVARLEQAGAGRVIATAADVADEESIAQAVSTTVDRLGPLDVLVTSAGTSMRARRALVETSTDEWMRLVDANLTGAYLTIRNALSHMERTGSGYVITIMSTASFHSSANGGLYAATKYGVRALTESLIEEYRGTGIRVSSISPGPVDTSIWDRKLEPPTATERALMLHPADVADTVGWLLDRPPHVHVQDITLTPWVAADGSQARVGPDRHQPVPTRNPRRKGQGL